MRFCYFSFVFLRHVYFSIPFLCLDGPTQVYQLLAYYSFVFFRGSGILKQTGRYPLSVGRTVVDDEEHDAVRGQTSAAGLTAGRVALMNTSFLYNEKEILGVSSKEIYQILSASPQQSLPGRTI